MKSYIIRGFLALFLAQAYLFVPSFAGGAEIDHRDEFSFQSKPEARLARPPGSSWKSFLLKTSVSYIPSVALVAYLQKDLPLSSFIIATSGPLAFATVSTLVFRIRTRRGDSPPQKNRPYFWQAVSSFAAGTAIATCAAAVAYFSY